MDRALDVYFAFKSVRQLPGNNFKQFMNGNCRFVFRYIRRRNRKRGVPRVQLILGVVTLLRNCPLSAIISDFLYARFIMNLGKKN